MTRTLVTGARGFVGRPVLERLVARGEEVHAISTRPAEGGQAGVQWWQLDLSRAEQVERVVREIRPERLLHLAWYVEHGRFWEAPENVDWVQWSLHLLRCFVASGGRRAAMLGTCAEYDWSDASSPLRELASPLVPGTLYGTAKDALRRVAETYCRREGVELAWARLFFLYGPGEPPGRLVPAVIRSLLSGSPAQTTSGTQRRDFMHVEDVARGLLALLDSGVTGPVNLASGQPVAVRELVELIAAGLGRPELLRPGAVPDRPDDPDLLVADVARLREEVGFTPSLTLAQGIEETLAWWSRQDPEQRRDG